MKDLNYTKMETVYELNTNKPSPTRDPLTVKLEKDIIQFSQEGDRCNGKSPVIAEGST